MLWVDIDFSYTYDLFINNEKIYTVLKHREHCPNGLKLYFESELLVKQIKFTAIDESEYSHNGDNWINFLRLFEPVNTNLKFPPHCNIKL